MEHQHWELACTVADLVEDSGVCALVNGQQVALFYLPATEAQIFATGNFDPAGWANVLSRGIVGDLGGEWVVASPLYKHHYRLRDGNCLEKPEISIPAYPARIADGKVWVRLH